MISNGFFNFSFLKFIMVGIANTLFGYMIYVLILAYYGYAIAYVVSFLLSVPISYMLNSVFVFKTKMSVAKMLKFPVVYAFQFLFGFLLLFVLVDCFKMNEAIAPFVLIVSTVPLTFVLSKIILVGR